MAAVTPVDEPSLAARVQAWSVADGEQLTAALQRVVQACERDQGRALRSSSSSVQQQLLTLLLQSSHSSAPVPSAAATVQHHYKLMLERLWRLLTQGLPADERSCDTLEAVIAAHTPAAAVPSSGSASNSRRNSVQFSSTSSSGAPTGAGSRRGSLSQPIEELAVASIRQQAFTFAFDWVRAQADQTSASTPSQHSGSGDAPAAAASSSASLSSSSQVSGRMRSLFVRGVTDMWSAIRKTAAGALARSPLVPRLTDDQLQEMLETLTRMALGQTTAAGVDGPNETRVAWQVQEGAMLGISALLTALRQRKATHPTRPLPSLQVTRFYPLLAHPQLSVRQHTGAVLRSYLQLLPESQSAPLRHDLLETLMRKLAGDSSSLAVDSSAAQQQQWLSDYECEGILKVVHELDLPPTQSHVDVLDRYLGHPASSVRQLVADVLARLALQQRDKGADSSAPAPASWNLAAFLASEWDWVECEAEAAAAAQVSYFTDAHTTAVFFAIPPPLSVAPPASRRGSIAHASPALGAGPAPVVAVPPLPADALASHPHRSSWQWKEGALMALELYLRALASQFAAPPSADASPSDATLAALARLFSQVVRASTSWSWELRRMAEQIRTPFLAVWLRFAPHSTSPDVARMCMTWMHDEHTTHTPVATRPSVPLGAAVWTAMALKYTLVHLQRVQLQATKRTAALAVGEGAQADEDDPGVDRKWNQDVEDLSVHPHVCQALVRHLPQLLSRLEQLSVTAQLLTDHTSLATLTPISTPTPTIASPSVSAGRPSATPSLVSWDQFATLASEVIVLAYAVDFGQLGQAASDERSAPSGTSPPSASLHVSEQGKLQHYQCVLDRLRMIRCLCVGEDHLPAPSVAAQMPPFPAPSSPSSTVAGAHLLPSLAPINIPSPSPPPPPLVAPAKTAMLQRAKAKRLELWLLTHVGSSMAAFAGAVPAGAHVDLLDLLHDYLARYHTSSVEIRAALLHSVSLGWVRMRQSLPPLMSHQLQQLQESAFTLLLQLLHEHAFDRGLIVAALIAIVSATPVRTAQLRAVLECMAKLVHNDYLSISLRDPAPPSPSSLLSPTSAAVAAETEAWDDWDADEGGAGGEAVDSDSSSASAYDSHMHARQLVLAVSPLLVLLNTQPFVSDLSLAPTRRSSDQAHAQSSLAQLVSAYESETSSAQPDAARQVQLLQWIQQWAAQVQQHVETQQTGAAVAGTHAADSSASSGSSTVASDARISSHHHMPINAPLQDTIRTMQKEEQSKIAWLHKQIAALDAQANEPADS